MLKLKVFTATWCHPCKAMKPYFDALELEGLTVELLDIDTNGDEANRLGVKGVPYLILEKNGGVVATKQGGMTYGSLRSWVGDNQS